MLNRDMSLLPVDLWRRLLVLLLLRWLLQLMLSLLWLRGKHAESWITWQKLRRRPGMPTLRWSLYRIRRRNSSI